VTRSDNEPPRSARALRSLVDGHARAEGLATARVQRWVAYMVLVAALDRVRDSEGEPLFLVKGGVAMELRLKLEARATKDFDATFREATELMTDRLDEALREPFAGFTLARGAVEAVGPTGARRVNVSLAYRGRPWSTVKLELSPAEGGTAVDVERVPAIDLTTFGLEGPETVPCLPIRFQVAQKLHACTSRRSDGKDNDRFRDLIDLILLRGLVDTDQLAAVRDACVLVFEGRGQQRWPPALEVPASWAAPYERLADEFDFAIRDVGEAADRVRVIIGEIDDHKRGPWSIVSGPEEVRPLADHHRFRCVVARGDVRRDVFVEITGTAWATDINTLPSPVNEAVRTRGASELTKVLDKVEPPARIVVSTTAVTVVVS
jgi:hypothetical protein